MKKRHLAILLSPYVLALIISLAAIYFLPDIFSKYKAVLVEHSILNNNDVVYFQDLNNDHKSEKIVCQTNSLGNFNYLIYSHENVLIDQWNLNGKPLNKEKGITFHDADKNGFMEIYIITRRLDSAFLNISEPLRNNNKLVKQVFVDNVKSHLGQYHLWVGEDNGFRKNHTDFRNGLFTINSGFGGYPRNVYKYDFLTDSIHKSPHLTNVSAISSVIDLNGDGKNEILLHNRSSSNNLNSAYTKRSDYSSWLSVLDSNLNFIFDPIQFNSSFSNLRVFPYKKDNENLILILYNPRDELKSNSKILIYSILGEKRNEKTLSPNGVYRFLYDSTNETYAAFNIKLGELQIFDNNLEVTNTVSLEAKSHVFKVDLDGNSTTLEWIFISPKNKLTISSSNLKHQLIINPPDSNNNENLHWGMVEVNESKYNLYIKNARDLFIYDYKINPIYYTKYAIYIGIYFFTLVIIFLIIKGQKLRELRKKELEDEIAELQLKTIKNQVDPHFVFNAINTISDMMLMDDKLEADKLISEFSSLMRKTLLCSDKIVHTLKEELDYLDTYVKFQQIRYKNSFDYLVFIDPSINQKLIIPKHVLYTYVENAIKHGLARNSKNGKLLLNIFQDEKYLKISIENNGSGMSKSSSHKKKSTGYGIRIMNEIFELYSKRFKKKIKCSLTDIRDSDNLVRGVKVEIQIPIK